LFKQEEGEKISKRGETPEPPKEKKNLEKPLKGKFNPPRVLYPLPF